ncbi:MAG: tagaturonate epimerase family protein [Phycisphaeraceae bacterium]
MTNPTPLGLKPSFGFGDRLGVATPGHLRALQQHGEGIAGVFAQQSIREMTRTARSAQDVMNDAVTALRAVGYDQPWGADADHLKTRDDVDVAAAAGFVFFTIDPSDHVDQQADDYDEQTLASKYEPEPWVERYLHQTVQLDDGTEVRFDEPVVKRAVVKYGAAIREAIQLAHHIAEAAERHGRPHEVEISVDETAQPTTLAEHYIIADQLLEAGVKLVSLAPRFIGELEKGVDYKGDLDALEQSIAEHAAVARRLGPYKLSLHSGSDKLSMYSRFARSTRGLFHVKTAGTSYLEALRVVARYAPDVFRDIVIFSREHYEKDRATYHVSATLDHAPHPDQVREDQELERLYLETWSDPPAKAAPGEPGSGFTRLGRQILHCTFGSVVGDAELGSKLRRVLQENPDAYADILTEHFGKHLDALNRGLSSQ